MRSQSSNSSLYLLATFCMATQFVATCDVSAVAATVKAKKKSSGNVASIKKESQFGLAVEYYNDGCTYLQSKNYMSAIACYKEARAADPSFLASYNNEACCYTELKRPDLAIDLLSKGIKLDKKNIQSDEKYWEMFHNRGNAYMMLKQYDKALPDFSAALSHDTSLMRSITQANRGLCYMHLGEYQKAADDFNYLIRLRLTDNATQNARVIADLGLKECAQLKQLDVMHSASDATSFMAKDQFEDAVKALNKGLKVDAHNINALMLRAICQAHLHNEKASNDDFATAEKLSPKDGKIPMSKGVAELALHQPEKAKADFQKAIELNYTSPSVYSGLATAQIHLNQYDDAVKSINESIRHSPNDPDLYNLRSLAYLITDTGENAISDANTYLDKTAWKGNHAADCFLRVYLLSNQLKQTEQATKIVELATANFPAERWEHTLVSFLKDEIDADKLLAAAQGKEQQTDAKAFIAIKTAVRGDKDKAIEQLRDVRDNGSKDAKCYLLAVVELVHLTGSYKRPQTPLNS